MLVRELVQSHNNEYSPHHSGCRSVKGQEKVRSEGQIELGKFTDTIKKAVQSLAIIDKIHQTFK